MQLFYTSKNQGPITIMHKIQLFILEVSINIPPTISEGNIQMLHHYFWSYSHNKDSISFIFPCYKFNFMLKYHQFPFIYTLPHYKRT